MACLASKSEIKHTSTLLSTTTTRMDSAARMISATNNRAIITRNRRCRTAAENGSDVFHTFPAFTAADAAAAAADKRSSVTASCAFPAAANICNMACCSCASSASGAATFAADTVAESFPGPPTGELEDSLQAMLTVGEHKTLD